MKSYHQRSGLLAIATLACLSAAPALANVEGMWLVKDGTILRIRNCGDAMCGSIAAARPSTGQPVTDKNNTDPSQRNRSLVGVQVLHSMRPSGPGKWTGRLYNVEDGKTYTGNLIEVGPDAIRIEGCWLGVCGGENLTRAKSTASSH